jgi:hypothetical protein
VFQKSYRIIELREVDRIKEAVPIVVGDVLGIWHVKGILIS